MWTGIIGVSSLTEAEKTNLLDKVADNFRKYDFVSEIEVIPSAYLTEGGSFQNLDQIKTMYGTDVIALVSYDQVQFTDEGLLSLTYWTLLAAYVISGEKNDTSTMLDTAVYDIESRKMLFRAPGTSSIKGRSTPINLSEELRADV
jgi:rhombotail lipoprotein